MPLSDAVKQAIHQRARGGCEYCQSQEEFSPSGFSIEHVLPRIAGGGDEIDNLALSCQECNNHKFTTTLARDPLNGESVPLYHPRQHAWSDHFTWNEEFTLLLGLTPTGRATVEKLQLNRSRVVNLRRVLDRPEALAAVERVEGWRSLGDNVIETIINKSEKLKDIKKKAKEGDLSPQEKKELSAEEKEYKSKRKQIQEKLIKFATRIPAFMYLTDFRENTLQDVITKLEPDMFLTVTGLTVQDFHLLVRLKVFNTEQMNQAVFAFRRYEDASLRYTGLESHHGLTHYGLYDTVVARE